MTRKSGESAPVRRTQADRRVVAKRSLLDAAASLVSSGGARAATLAAVGESAGYSRGIVGHHFGSRRGLLEELVVGAQERLAPPEGRPLGLSRLFDFIDTYIEHLRGGDPYGRAFLLLWAESAGEAADLRSMFAERDQTITEEIIGNLAAARSDGSTRADLDLEGTSAALIAQLRGLGLQMIVAGDAFDAERARAAILDNLRHAVGAASR